MLACGHFVFNYTYRYGTTWYLTQMKHNMGQHLLVTLQLTQTQVSQSLQNFLPVLYPWYLWTCTKSIDTDTWIYSQNNRCSKDQWNILVLFIYTVYKVIISLLTSSDGVNFKYHLCLHQRTLENWPVVKVPEVFPVTVIMRSCKLGMMETFVKFYMSIEICAAILFAALLS